MEYVIIKTMHKDFYASGFLYHPLSQKILLQQQSSLQGSSSWGLIEGSYIENEETGTSFKKIIQNLLDIKITIAYPVYSYINESINKNQHVFYGVLKNLKNVSITNDPSFAWFSLKNITKMHMGEQIKHDIVVGQRVIEAADRKSRGEHTFQ